MENGYYVGLDIGTNSVGYAVTDEKYTLKKYHGEPMWGSAVFEEAKTKAERRGFRTARRRLDRRQQRVKLTQEIFAKEIAKVDASFFIRIKESGLYREDTTTNRTYLLFQDKNYSDVLYHKEYPTIHHLILSIMNDDKPKDVRLVYIAVAWLMAHRGHFLSEVDKTKLDQVLDFSRIYQDFEAYCIVNYEKKLWECESAAFQEVMSRRWPVTKKEKAFQELICNGSKYKDSDEDSVSRAAIIRLLSGGKVKAEKLFLNAEYSQIESISLGMPQEGFEAILTELGEDGEILLKLRALYDWMLLNDLFPKNDNNGDTRSISAAKVEIYDKHKRNLCLLKHFVRKYIPERYHQIFKEQEKDNYAAYSGHGDKRCNRIKFHEFLKKQITGINVSEKDFGFYQLMMTEVDACTFLPKQVDGDNRVIPYQLYWDELNKMLQKAKRYLPFLTEVDKDGYSNIDKLLSIFEFRIPYYVGPLRVDNGKYGWMKRKTEGNIYPWNFNEKVDLDASEQAFISRMINNCSYLPTEEVLPKSSLIYESFIVLNEINPIKVNDVSIPVEVKRQIFEKFKEYKKVSVKKIIEVLKANGCFQDGDILSGIDITIKSSLRSYHIFKKMLDGAILHEKDAERIIRQFTYTEDKARLRVWLEKEYPNLNVEDQKYLLHQKFQDFGRLSSTFLQGMQGVCKQTGEVLNIMDALWQTNDTLMQLLSERYTFGELIQEAQKDYYSDSGKNIEAVLDQMYITPSVRRPIYRTLAILEDIRKATKSNPKRIFLEMARGDGEKNKRTKSRRDQIEELYANMEKEEIRELSRQLEGKSDRELQSEVLFLYFMQLGQCMYTGEKIDINALKLSKYNVDHILPQSKIKDDSITNKVLVLSTANANKGDGYPVPKEFRDKMASTWAYLHHKGMISDEKYQRLLRNTPFRDEELQGFINRQLVETRQSTKAMATILQQIYPDTEIVYVKAGLVSDFRQEFDILKCRSLNDLHHGKDAYLNIVCGNVYFSRFTKNFYITKNRDYSIKTKTIFTHAVFDGEYVVWDGSSSLKEVLRVMEKNHLHYTRFSFERKGMLFAQLPLKAGNGSVTRKTGMPIDKYGGYNKPTASFFLLVRYLEKKKTDIMYMPVELMVAEKVMGSTEQAMRYAKSNIANIIGKKESEIEIIDFPLGLRKLKVNTILRLNEFHVAVTGKTSGGSKISVSSMESLKISKEQERYVKRIEKINEKLKNRVVMQVDEQYDKISAKENLFIYDLLTEKLCSNIYRRMFEANIDYMRFSRDKFSHLSLEEQVILLMNVLSIFQTGRTGGCDLREIGEKKESAVLTLSTKLSNWKKRFSDVRIIDCSPSGIYESRSCNLMELI